MVVDSAKVQESGLLKDTIILDIPDEVGQFDTVLVRRATDKLKESSAAWAEYAKQQDDADDGDAADGAAGAEHARPQRDRACARHDLSALAGTAA